MNRNTLKQALIMLAEIYEKDITQATLEAYWLVLQEKEDRELLQAVKNHIKKSKWFPKPSELLEEIEGDMTYKSEKAWNEIQEAINRYGIYESVEFADTKINEAIQLLGGWVAINMIPVSEVEYKKKEFMKIYQTCKGKAMHLPGITEAQNTFNGFDKYEIHKIGYGEKKVITHKTEPTPEPPEELVAIDIEGIVDDLAEEKKVKKSEKK